MKIVVTGAAGGLGKALLPSLCADSRVESVVGIDREPPTFKHPNFVSCAGDIRSLDLGSAAKGASVVIHLAFSIRRDGKSLTEMRENNVVGTRNVFSVAASCGVKKIINLSSVSVYGTGENLNEDAPLNPSPRFPYACHKAEVEMLSRTEFSSLNIVNLRSTFVLGRNALPFLKKMCNSRVYISPSRPHPNIQVVHEADVASAIIAALNPAVVGGAFNVAAPEAITFPRLIKHDRTFMLGIPLSIVDLFVGKGSTEVRPIDSALELLRVPLTVSCEKARKVLGWAPRFSAWQARADSA